MPLYEFVCSKCGHQFEVLIRRPSDEKELNCPKCQNKKATKCFSTFATSGGEKGGNGSPSSACGSCSGGTCATCR
jgi:putative FmdB family regulatory protein